MRALFVFVSIALALAVACQIPRRSFQLVDDASSDGSGSSDAGIDAPTVKPLGKLYFTSVGSGSSAGIYLLAKDGSGNLSVPASITQPVASGSNSPTYLLLGSDGHQLYSVEDNGVTHKLAHYAIQADGTLLRLNDAVTLPVGGGRAAIDPSGTWIVVATGSTTVTIVTLDTTGKPVSAMSSATQMSMNIRDVAFARGGACLLAVSSAQTTGTTTLNKLLSFPFANGALSPAQEATGFLTATRVAVHPNGAVAYVANSQASNVQVQAYSVASTCAVNLLGSPVNGTDTGAADLAVDPAGKYLFASAHAITRITLAAAGDLTLSLATYLPQSSGYAAGVAMDPLVPDRVYVVGSGYSDGANGGGLAASIDGSGALAEVSHAYVAPLGGDMQAIQLAP